MLIKPKINSGFLAAAKMKTPKKKPRQEESNMQIALVKWFRLQYKNKGALLFSIPNGGSRNVLEAMKLKREGALAGVPDLMLAHAAHGHHGLFIEMKRKKGGKVSDDQFKVIESLRSAGYRCEIINNQEDFMSLIKWYMDGKDPDGRWSH